MGKAVLLLSFIGVGIVMTLAAVAPNASAIWLADTSFKYEVIRAVMMVVLFVLLITNPPRNIYLRYLVGTFSALLVGFTLYQTYTNHMQLLDSFSFLLVGICSGIDALEPDAESEKVTA